MELDQWDVLFRGRALVDLGAMDRVESHLCLLYVEVKAIELNELFPRLNVLEVLFLERIKPHLLEMFNVLPDM